MMRSLSSSRAAAAAGLRPTLCVLALAACTAAQAQAPRDSALQPMVVTATRTAQPLADLVADVTLLDRQAIETSGALSLSDLLARQPGVEFARNGGPGTTTSLYLRGGETRFTAVYIDGVRVDSQSTGGAPWEAIPLALVDRIEVLRGPAGAVYGSDAVAGVIQIFTRKGEGAAVPYVGVGAGSRSTWRAEAGVSGAAGAFDYTLGLLHDQSKGFNARPIAGQNPDRDGYRQQSGNARLGWQINPAHRLDATLLASHSNAGYDSPGTLRDDRAINDVRTLGLTWSGQWTRDFASRVSLSDARSEYETTPSPYRSRTDVRSLLWHNEWRSGAHLLTAALERREDALVNGAIDRSRAQNALALGWGWQAGAHTLQANLRSDDDSEFGRHHTGSLAYGLAFAPQWRATASVGTSFRAPTLYQRFSEYGQAHLQPEKGENAELGLRWSQGASQVSATVYRNRVKNLINFGAAGPCASPYGCYASVGRAVYEGLTLSAAHRVGSVNLRASLDLQDPHDRDTGRLLARRAKRHGTLAADTRVGAWQVGAEVQASGHRFDDAANTRVLGGYTLVNLFATTQVARDFTLLARVDNLADKDYQLARTYATPGRTLYVGLKWAPK